MLKNRLLACLLVFSLALFVGACGGGSSDDETDGADAADAADAADGEAGEDSSGCDIEVDPFVAPIEEGEGCQFDSSNKGKIMGKSIKNFTTKTFATQDLLNQTSCEVKELHNTYNLHSNCGEKKVVWMILATGW